ncbi:unnamed protein product [Lymnaea stagnalis]|uniref:X-ray radiation resistance-associated protein 1 n=2 Tax=Lymnaea stagnalis TaxID=6523 RepID=A0AAV2H8H2_LYMST
MALSGVKFDDGKAGFVPNCFPVRSTLGQNSNEASGKWLVAHQAEQLRRFKTVLCAKPLTYARIKDERKKSELRDLKLDCHNFQDEGERENEEGKTLDGFFLMKHCCIEDPSDLCSVNIANKELTDVKEDDLTMFENVAYVNAGENYLPFEAFRHFPSLRELELPLNGLRNLQISHSDFTNLEMLDLSYNNLSEDDLLTLGLLSKLKVLHLTGNSFVKLPMDMAMPYLSREKQVRAQRYANLEILLLDDNKLKEMSVFATLAGLPKLRHLDLSKNEINFVPQLKSVEGRVVTQDGKIKRSNRFGSSRKSSRQSKRSSAKDHKQNLVDSAVSHTSTKIDVGEAATESEDITSAESEKIGTSIYVELLIEDLLSHSIHSDLMADVFNTSDLTARIEELGLEASDLSEPQEQQGSQIPPFPELRYLNLVNNLICEEDGLLAVAAWPMLSEIDIYNNPLTTEINGDPPLLKRFLEDRLGIRLNRKKPMNALGYTKKSKAEIRPKNIKITETVPKVPKLSLEEKMMLESPPRLKAISQGHKDNIQCTSLETPILPPITSSPKIDSSDESAENFTQEETVEAEEGDQTQDGQDSQSDTFFMTQLGDVGESQPGHPPKEQSLFGTAATKSGENDKRGTSNAKAVDDKFKGYELLLDIEELDDEPVLPLAKDVQGNLRTLKHTLNHMLVYRDPAVELTHVKKMVQEYRRVPVPPSKPARTYQEKVNDVLTHLKTRSTVEEEKLINVLRDRRQLRKKFPEAENLLGQIQRRYNAVRLHSLKDAKEA